MQIDTALRFSALSLVDDPEAFADAVLGDERIDRLTDRNGERLRDAYLVERLVGVAPWLPEVYACTSAYIHLSGQHIFSAIQHLDDETRTISMLWFHSTIATRSSTLPCTGVRNRRRIRRPAGHNSAPSRGLTAAGLIGRPLPVWPGWTTDRSGLDLPLDALMIWTILLRIG